MEKEKNLSFLPPREFQTPLSLGTPRLPINLPRKWLSQYLTIYTEWSKSERQKQILYIWNIEKWYWWTYLQGKTKDAHMENELVDRAGEGEGGTNWESSIETYTFPFVKYLANGKLLYSTGSLIWYFVTT